MKKIRFDIKKLGAVRDSVVELHPLMILSGESNLGKSYVALVIHYFYKLLTENRFDEFFLDNHYEYEILAKKYPDKGSFTFSTKDLLFWIEQDAKNYLRDSIGNNNLDADIKFYLPIDRDELTFSYQTELFGLVGKEELYVAFEMEKIVFRIPSDAKNIGVIPWTWILQDYLMSVLLEDNSVSETFAMVPGRGALLNVPLTYQDKIKGGEDIYAEFLKDWDIVRSMASKKNTNTDLVTLLRKINGGKIEMDTDQSLVYRMENEEAIPISAAASSIKELAPLDMLLDKYPVERLSILFEEPEAHIHPQKQISIADFIVQLVNRGAHLQITTHSDYLLRRINDRIFLYKISELLDEKEYKDSIEKFGYTDLNLDPSLIGAYLLKRENDGTVKVVSQDLEKGIPYESFYSVVNNDIRYSMDIQQTYYSLKHVE